MQNNYQQTYMLMVDDVAEVTNYFVAPGATVTFMSRREPVIWAKTGEQFGPGQVKTYDIVERKATVGQEYATKADLQEILRRLEELQGGVKGNG